MGKTREIIDGAIILAIFLIFMLISLNVIGLGFITIFLLPLPFIIFTIKHGYKKSFILVIAALMLSVAVGSILTLFAALMFASTGVVIGELFHRKQQDYFILLVGSVVFLINMVLIYVLSILFLKVNMINEAIESLRASTDSASSFLKAIGQKPKEEMVQNLNNMFDMFQTLVPSSFILGSVIFTFITLAICKPILKRLRLTTNSWPPFRNFILPKSLLWYYLLVTVFMFIPFEKGTFMYIALVNLFYLLQILMIIQGFSFIIFYSYQKGIKKAILIIMIILSFIMPFLMDIIRILGIIDLGFNLRKRLSNDT